MFIQARRTLGVRIDPFEIAPQVFTVGILRNRQDEESPGLEPASKEARQVGHLGRVALWLMTLVQFLISSVESRDFGLLVMELSRTVGLPFDDRQFGQPVKGLEINGIGIHQTFQCPPFQFRIAAPGRQPSRQPVDLGGC